MSNDNQNTPPAPQNPFEQLLISIDQKLNAILANMAMHTAGIDTVTKNQQSIFQQLGGMLNAVLTTLNPPAVDGKGTQEVPADQGQAADGKEAA